MPVNVNGECLLIVQSLVLNLVVCKPSKVSSAGNMRTLGV